jgi:hypothetical protein
MKSSGKKKIEHDKRRGRRADGNTNSRYVLAGELTNHVVVPSARCDAAHLEANK